MRAGTMKGLKILAFAGVGLLVRWVLNPYRSTFAQDWHGSFYPAANALLHGANPYLAGTIASPVFTPIWGLALLTPFALFGEQVGGILFFLFNLLTLLLVVYRLRARFSTSIMLLLSPVAVAYLHQCNVDSLVLWGLLLPPPIALFFLVIKPQTGIAVAVFLAFIVWREGGFRKLLVTFIPVTLALIANLVFGIWTAGRTNVLLNAPYNMSLFPWSVPAGIALIILAVRTGKARYSYAASPLLSPFVGFGSWTVALLAMVENPYWMFGAVTVSWLVVFLHSRVLGG